jgi:hypothetical protein
MLADRPTPRPRRCGGPEHHGVSASLAGTFVFVEAKIAQNEKKINTFLTGATTPLVYWLKFATKAFAFSSFSMLFLKNSLIKGIFNLPKRNFAPRNAK